MRDLRTELERLGDRVRPTSDAFERLERRRRRMARNRRLGAGVLALTLTVGGSVAVFSAFRGGDEQTIVGVEVDTGFHVLWPETTLEGALAAQARVNSGDESWRRDPVQVAESFAGSVFGWLDPRLAGFSRMEPHELDDGRVAIGMFRCPFAPNGLCGMSAAIEAVTVTLDEVVEGVWSVVEVDGSALHTGLPVGAVVVDGSALTFDVSAPDGTEVQVALTYGPATCTYGHSEPQTVRNGAIVVRLAYLEDENCGDDAAIGLDAPIDGLIWIALMEPPSASALSLFSVEPNGNPEAGYVTDLAAVPVLFVPEGSTGSDVPDVARVTCDGSNTSVDTPVVAAQPAGVHVVVDNASEETLFFQFASDSRGPWGGTQLSPGLTELALQAPPGSVTVRCGGNDSVADEIQVEVLDPERLFVPIDLACPAEPVLASTISVAAWLGSEPAPDPVEFVRGRTEGLLSTDVVERAGYPQAPNPAVRVVRDGAVVGSFELYRDAGEWGMGGTWCSGIGITVPQGPDPYPRGWFEWCPDGPFAEPGQDWSERASEAAAQFVRAYVDGPEEASRGLLDASVPLDAEFPITLAEDVGTVFFTSARGGDIVDYSCGRDVDAYTVAITIDDGTESASADFTVFLVLRQDGWKVWGVY